MRWIVCLWVVCLGCTKPNPESCADGSCTDPDFPFCDVDGSVRGTPNRCIAVSCEPSKYEACRGDDEIVCNESGNNFDVIRCPLGCADDLGCRECVVEADCAASSFVCDTDISQCRGCLLDAECESNACDVDTGKCLPASAVLYASANGTVSAPCTLADPCALSRAISVATNPAGSTIRMLPGDYTETVTITNKKISFLGSGAIHTGEAPDSFKIGDRADVFVRDLEFDLSRGHLQCRATAGNPRARMILRNVVVREPTSNHVQVRDCNVLISGAEILELGSLTIFSVGRNSLVDIDRTTFRASGSSPFSAVFISELGSDINGSDAAAVDVRIINSVFDDVNVLFALGSASQVRFAYNTHSIQNLNNTSPVFTCDQSVGAATVTVDNSILHRTGQDAVVGSNCSFNHNLITFQNVPVDGSNMYDEARFANLAGHDYRLRSDSLARDSAGSTNLDTDHDHANTVRPQGPAKDIGAFEFVP